MRIAVTVGAYRLHDFVALCLRATKRLWPEADLLVSDDISRESPQIEAVADAEGASYIRSERRRSHCSGDVNCFISAQVFATQVGADIALKLSQRFIPLTGRFRSLIEDPFSDPNIWMVFPPQMQERYAARPSTRFYHKLPLLTDALAWRPDRITPEIIMQTYRDRCLQATSKETQHLQLAEHLWHALLEGHFRDHACGVDELANPKPMSLKSYLRKAQSNRGEYVQAAADLGLDGSWDVREWVKIEAPGEYHCRPSLV